MAGDPLQILNLSPIPEMSEIELSNVLEQLSSLSDPTGEITDRNVEDILREAEDLLEKSSSIKEISDMSNDSVKNDVLEKDSEVNKPKEETEPVTDNDMPKEKPEPEKISLNDQKLPSPLKDISTSSTDSTNHIKSTIDFLKDYSKMMESQLNSKSEAKRDSDVAKETNKVRLTLQERKLKESIPSAKKSSAKDISTSNSGSSKSSPVNSKSLAKQLKTIAEVQSHGRLNTHKTVINRLSKPHPIRSPVDNAKKWPDRLHKTPIGKKNVKSKPSASVPKTKPKVITEKKNKIPSMLESKNLERGKESFTESVSSKCTEEDLNIQECLNLIDQEINPGKGMECNLKCTEEVMKHSKEFFTSLQKEIAELKTQLTKKRFNEQQSKWSSELAEKFWAQENLIASLKDQNSKLFKEIEDIKGSLKSTLNADHQAERIMKEKQDMIENLRSEIESLRKIMISTPSDNPGIVRLEEQFTQIKDKYNRQIEKLELENKELKNALLQQETEVIKTSQKLVNEGPCYKDVEIQTEEIFRNLNATPNLSPIKLTRTTSLENCRTGKSKTWENKSATGSSKEAFCQTERQKTNVGTQSEELNFKKLVENNRNVLEPRKIENKENVLKKPTLKSTSEDVGHVLNSLRSKKATSELESQLMATMRGLNSEIMCKDKENRKLKNEIEALKKDLKKWTNSNANAKKPNNDTRKKVNVGTQTIGLGPCVPYDPALFQVSKELENENEELKTKMKTLEETCERLKSKRIADLEILQQIHEEEMGKLISKLETQTALAKHLHFLLIARRPEIPAKKQNEIIYGSLRK